MNASLSEELLRAIAQIRVIFPDWRMGQLLANLVTAAGTESIWDVEDTELLMAARRLIERNQGRPMSPVADACPTVPAS